MSILNEPIMFSYKKLTLWLVMAACFVATLTPAFAQDDAQETEKKKIKVQWVPLPVVMYKPVNGWGFGALGMALFKPNGVDSTTRTSNVSAYFIYTTKGQILFSPDYNLFLDNDSYWLKGKLRYFAYPQDYYGLGNELTSDTVRINIDYKQVSFDQDVLKKVGEGLFIGARYSFNSIYNLKFDPKGKNPENYGLLYEQEQRTAGFDGYKVSGLGLVFAYDTRDNIVNASKGHYLGVEANFYQKFLGSDYSYTNIKIDARKYIKVFKNYNHILAMQAYGHFTNGVAPFMELAQLGGDERMRGYSGGRYRDNHYMAFQAEYRMPIWWRFGLAAFGGFGDVAENFSDFGFDTLKPSYGAGLRIAINKKESVNIRADYGMGAGSSGFYLQIKEAF